VTARLAWVGGEVVDLAALSKVVIDTEGAAPIVSKETYVNATITITGDYPLAARSTQIRGRGNSTWEAAKKPYRINLTSAASLVPGIAADRAWVLLANFFDPERLRSATAFEIAHRVTGLPWVPSFRNVEVILNGDRIGLYQLGEHAKIATARINIGSAGTSGLALTGGYTLAFDANDPTAFVTSHDALNATMDDPDGANATQLAYIEGHLDAFETALYGANWLHPTLGYARYVDLDSFAAWYLVEELTGNEDSDFFKSCRFYKARDPDASTLGKLFMGPVWDFDLSLGNLFSGERDPEGIYVRPGAAWFVRMFDDPTFAALIATRWAALKASLTTGTTIYDFVDATAARLGYGANRELIRWANGNVIDHATAAATVNTWLAARIAYLDTQFT
jgi:hypothetical protein